MLNDNKIIVARWFREFWGNPWNPYIVDELASPDVLVHYAMYGPRGGRTAVTAFMTELRRAFPDLDFRGVGDLLGEGDYIVSRWEGGGTHTGSAFSDFRMGSIAAASGRKMRFSGTTVFRLQDGRIAEEIGQEDSVTAMLQLGLLRAPDSHVGNYSGPMPLPPGMNRMKEYTGSAKELGR